METKADDSPLTNADHAANDIICSALGALTPHIPIVSEENKATPYEIRRARGITGGVLGLPVTWGGGAAAPRGGWGVSRGVRASAGAPLLCRCSGAALPLPIPPLHPPLQRLFKPSLKPQNPPPPPPRPTSTIGASTPWTAPASL